MSCGFLDLLGKGRGGGGLFVLGGEIEGSGSC